MAFNQILFQYGMSIPEFLRNFGNEAQCGEAIKATRLPEGFRCPSCSSSDHYVVGYGARKLIQCNRFRHQTALTAGSLMAHTSLRPSDLPSFKRIYTVLGILKITH